MTSECVVLVFCFLSFTIISSQRESPTTPPSLLNGPCRSWLSPCEDGTWSCTTEEEYLRFYSYPQPGCPAVLPVTTTPPPGECLLVNGTCQFTNDTLECTTWLNRCQGYQCGSTLEYSTFLESPGVVCPLGGQYPQPNDLCLPINGTCQWYNPCRSWRGFCLGGYNCGSADQYYRFLFGPQPICALPPFGWVEPEPPGECAVRNGQCDWYNCTAWLDWCRTYWTCGTQYEEEIYRAGPIPACAAPPPGYQPPPQLGSCRFNVSAGQCQFTVNPTNGCPDDAPMVLCFTDPCGECPNFPDARCEVNYCGGCSAVYYDERGNNVTDYCRTPIDCNSLRCPPGSECVADPTTGVASCVGLCEERVSHCRNDQLCTIQRYNWTYCDPSPCQHPVCYNAPYVPCSSTNVIDECVANSNSRCLVQNKTRQVDCVESCFENNGGCPRDQVCINAVQECSATYGAYQCSSRVECLQLNDVSPSCPAGWEYSTCGSACGADCDSLLAKDPVLCPLVCYSGCFCPRGLVAYRDRCVDPKECFVLLSDPPPANPLPVKSTTVLLKMTIPRVTTEQFKNKTGQFLNSLHQLLQDTGYVDVTVTIHAVYFDEELQVVVQLSGDSIGAAKASELVSVIDNDANSLALQVSNVVAVPTQTVQPDSGTGLSVGAIVGITIAALLVLMLAVVLVVLVVVFALKHNTNRQMRQQEFSNDMIYSKLSGERCSPVIQDAVENFEEQKEAL